MVFHARIAVFGDFSDLLIKMNGRTDIQTHGHADGQTFLNLHARTHLKMKARKGRISTVKSKETDGEVEKDR